MGVRDAARSQRRIAVVVAAGLLSVAAGSLLVASPASAQGIPSKTCTDTHRSDHVAQPGDTITCTLSFNGVLASGMSFWVQPTAPSGAFIPVGGCAGAAGGPAPFNYTTTATSNGHLGSIAGACILTVSGIANGSSVLGTERVVIPAGVAPGSAVSQHARDCLAASACGPFTPMGVSGPGSCVGGLAIPILGGCQPGSRSTPPPTHSPGSTGGGGNGGQTGASNSRHPSGVEAESTSTSPFTRGPDHPLPWAAIALAAGGAALALGGIAGPALLRRTPIGRLRKFRHGRDVSPIV